MLRPASALRTVLMSTSASRASLVSDQPHCLRYSSNVLNVLNTPSKMYFSESTLNSVKSQRFSKEEHIMTHHEQDKNKDMGGENEKLDIK
jgi:hypothetical protein